MIVVVDFRPPRDHNTRPSSSWAITWHVAVSRISKKSSNLIQTPSSSSSYGIEIESVTSTPIFRPNLHLNPTVIARERINHIGSWMEASGLRQICALLIQIRIFGSNHLQVKQLRSDRCSARSEPSNFIQKHMYKYEIPSNERGMIN